VGEIAIRRRGFGSQFDHLREDLEALVVFAEFAEHVVQHHQERNAVGVARDHVSIHRRALLELMAQLEPRRAGNQVDVLAQRAGIDPGDFE
jgi:endonuclease/exonuclease/phosphatase family metal-dependent hydrolase